MSKVKPISLEIVPAAPTTLVAPATEEDARWAKAREMVEAAMRFERCKLACQVYAGFELLELHKQYEVRGGRPKKLLNACGVKQELNIPKWPELVKERLGIAENTARNWMDMAQAAAPRLKKMPGFRDLPLLSAPVSSFTVEQQEMLSKAVHKITDAKTQMEFMWEMGVAKKPQGSGARGGARIKDAAGQEIEQDKAAEAHDLLWVPHHQFMADWAAHWMHLPRADMQAIHDNLIDVKRQLGEALKKAGEA